MLNFPQVQVPLSVAFPAVLRAGSAGFAAVRFWPASITQKPPHPPPAQAAPHKVKGQGISGVVSSVIFSVYVVFYRWAQRGLAAVLVRYLSN
ncbi:hypothetical protein CS022_18175 [Veronia nyctiphanis]|uniref:Uncharacterized protein n=1 Tax=Veronia nyctiphanis TaxID=1278244 RepID=A0A4Q0YMR3_9GAMM|nr:hypothetical protein CS022_18175 [Veronia nyctiphanis]